MLMIKKFTEFCPFTGPTVLLWYLIKASTFSYAHILDLVCPTGWAARSIAFRACKFSTWSLARSMWVMRITPML